MNKFSEKIVGNQKNSALFIAGIICLVILLDQALKFYMKLNFRLGESFEIFPWFQLCFVENNGMAFGIEWFDKLFLTLFRIVAVGLLCWYMHVLIKRKASAGYLAVIALITAGALGNILDCLFYGLIFTQTTLTSVASLVPFGQGYGSFFYGRVVDMLYFPLIHNAEGDVLFFQPVFNLADSCITVAVALLIIVPSFRHALNDSLQSEKADKKEDEPADEEKK